MDGRPTWTDCNEAGDYVVPNVLSPRDLVSRPDIMDETVPHTYIMVETWWRHSHSLNYSEPRRRRPGLSMSPGVV